jgi:transposase
MWTAGSWLLHHDNAPAHSVVRQFLAKHPIYTIPQPPYSPDLSPPDFFLLPKLKIALKGRRFQTVEDIITNATNDESDTAKILQTALPKVEKALGEVHCCARGLFWRG